MRILGLAAAGLLAILLLVPAAGAGPIHPQSGSASRREAQAHLLEGGSRVPYHNGTTLYCADCHTMHASLRHAPDEDGGTGADPGYPWETTPAAHLLKADDPVDLCLNCHDNVGGIPDVLGSDVNGLSERSAGFLDMPEVHNPRGHDLGRGLDTTPGQGACARCHFEGDPTTAKVTCLDCHNAHGNGNQRNLQWASDPDGTPTFGLFVSEGASGLAAYERDNVAYGTLNSVDLLEVSSMCLDCHHVFSGAHHTDVNGNGIFERHPAYDSERGGRNHVAQGGSSGTTVPEHWQSGTGSGFEVRRVPFVVDGATNFAAASVVSAESNGIFCLSCHKAHGSVSAFSMVWDLDDAVNRKGCDQCHAIQPLPGEGPGETSVPAITAFRSR